jgi:hypothetical protein
VGPSVHRLQHHHQPARDRDDRPGEQIFCHATRGDRLSLCSAWLPSLAASTGALLRPP